MLPPSKNGKISHHTFYSLYDRVKKEPSPPRSYSEAKKLLRELIYTSVGDRLVADVPLGCFLSGIDSSLIVAVAQDLLGGNLKPFQLDLKKLPLMRHPMLPTLHIISTANTTPRCLVRMTYSIYFPTSSQ